MVVKNHVLGVIPARAGSTRFPLKAITPILGKPLLQYVWESARDSQVINNLWIATDDDQIAQIARDFGANVMLTSSEIQSGTDRVAVVAQRYPADIIVNLQGDEPLLTSESIRKLVEGLQSDPSADIGTLAVRKPKTEGLDDPNKVKVVFDSNLRALYFSRQPLASSIEGDFFKHIGIYAFRKAALGKFAKAKPSRLEETEKLEQLRALEMGMKIKVVLMSHDTIGVDVPEDVLKVERQLADKRL